ncbi:hypothetical protein [Paenibacillus agricola]|uniref:Uncharacterized protein n=1 Tax=Paenibacillus agricola TaxID=2716264 RepID=A0ABX0IZM7_9BACL|nr:hypothetical protein [Paenibacillus agricola]NHN29435.1 hypothetical protein [Paenibacillus agricola]
MKRKSFFSWLDQLQENILTRLHRIPVLRDQQKRIEQSSQRVTLAIGRYKDMGDELKQIAEANGIARHLLYMKEEPHEP